MNTPVPQSTSGNLPLLQKAEEGMTGDEERMLTYHLMGALSAHVDPELWARLVSESQRAVLSGRLR